MFTLYKIYKLKGSLNIIPAGIIDAYSFNMIETHWLWYETIQILKPKWFHTVEY